MRHGRRAARPKAPPAVRARTRERRSAQRPAGNLERALEALGPGDHLCLLYGDDAERLDAIVPFIRIGLLRGERCMHIADATTASTVLKAVETAGFDVGAALVSGALVVATDRHAYVRDGTFDADRTIAWLADQTDAALAAGWTALRVAADMTWALGDNPAGERLLGSEAKLDRFFADGDALGICEYDRRRCQPGIVRDMLLTHAVLIAGRLLCPNPLHVPADRLLGADETHGVTRLKVTEDRHERERMAADIRRHLREQTAVGELGHLALRGATARELMDAAARAVSDAVGVELAKVLTLEPGGASLRLAAGVGWSDGLVGEALVPARDGSQAAYTLRFREPVVIEDVRSEARFEPNVLLVDHGAVAGMSTAIEGPDGPVGVLGAHTTRPRRFTTDDVQFLRSVANILGEHAARTAADARVARPSGIYSTLAETNHSIVRCADRETLFEATASIVASSGPFRMAWIGVVDGTERTIEPVASAGAVDGFLDGVSIRLEGRAARSGPTATAVREGRHVVCNDVASDPRMSRWREHALVRGYASSAAFPLYTGGRVAGVLVAYASEPGVFGEEEVRLLDDLAADLSYALDGFEREDARTAAERALRRADDILAAVAFEAAQVLASASWESCIDQVLERLGTASGADRIRLVRNHLTPDGRPVASSLRGWTGPAITGIDTPSVVDFRYTDHGFDRWLEVFRSGGVVTGHVRDLPPSEREILEAQALVSFTAVPIYVNNDNWGLLSFDACIAEREWSPSEIDAMRTAAGILGATIAREETENALRESEERFRLLAENAQDIIYRLRVEPDVAFEYVSPSIRTILGHEPGTFYEDATRFVTQFHPDDRAAVEKVVDSGQVQELLEARMIRPDGRVIWTESRQVPILDASGRLVAVEGIVRDVTERRQAEEELRESFAMLRRADDERRRLLSHLVSAQEDERHRIAADIHDDSIQAITALGIRIQTLRRMLTDPDQAELLNKLEQTAQHAIARLRHLMFELRPPALDRGGLAAALRSYLETVKHDAGTGYVLENHLESEPPGEARVTLYRIAQEALNNVRKHARARNVRVTVSRQDAGTLVVVRDDGVGIAGVAASAPLGHIGLVSMRERAELAGGRWSLDTIPGVGTTVSFWIPDRVDDRIEEPSWPA